MFNPLVILKGFLKSTKFCLIFMSVSRNLACNAVGKFWNLGFFDLSRIQRHSLHLRKFWEHDRIRAKFFKVKKVEDSTDLVQRLQRIKRKSRRLCDLKCAGGNEHVTRRCAYLDYWLSCRGELPDGIPRVWTKTSTRMQFVRPVLCPRFIVSYSFPSATTRREIMLGASTKFSRYSENLISNRRQIQKRMCTIVHFAAAAEWNLVARV